MKINQVHCLFEQSGTFKNEFLKLGIPSFDYDIKNDFKQTDFVCDAIDLYSGKIRTVNSFSNKAEKSLITSNYAKRFIKEFILS